MGYSPWSHKELDTTERLTHTLQSKTKEKKKEKKKRDFIEFIPDAYFPLEYIVTLKLYNLLESYEHVPPGIL